MVSSQGALPLLWYWMMNNQPYFNINHYADFFFCSKMIALGVLAGLFLFIVLALVRRQIPDRTTLTFLYVLLMVGALRFFLSCLGIGLLERYNDEVAIYSLIGLSLLYSIPPFCLLAMCWHRITHRPLQPGMMLAWYPVLVLLVIDGGLSYAYDHQDFQNIMGPLLFGNPLVALYSVMMGNSEFTNAAWQVSWFAPVTVVLLLLGSWIALVMARWQLERQRGCRT